MDDLKQHTPQDDSVEEDRCSDGGRQTMETQGIYDGEEQEVSSL